MATPCSINNCGVGFDLRTGGLTSSTQTTGGESIIDAVITNTPVGIRSSVPSNGTLHGSLVLNNIHLTNVPTAVGVADGSVVLKGTTGNMNIASWVQGNVYHGTSGRGQFVQAAIPAPYKDGSLLDGQGRIFGRTHPQYESFDVSQFVSIRTLGAKGDGVTDDTAAIQAALTRYGGCNKIIFFDAGVYYVTRTLTIPAGSRLVGEAWSVILGGGSFFSSQANPQVMVRAGTPASSGTLEITDLIFSTRGPAPGAIVMEWNVHGGEQGAAGMWDSHIRLGGATGTNLNGADCVAGTFNQACWAAFLGIHLTPLSSVYLEGTWVWAADHNADSVAQEQLTTLSGRGILSQSLGPVWMIGTASEHHALYQYSLTGAINHFLGLIQTETPYYEPSPLPHQVSPYNVLFLDPLSSQPAAWGLWAALSDNILVFGAGLYSFFSNYTQSCEVGLTCQTQIINIDAVSEVAIYGLATVGTTWQVSMDQVGIINATRNPDGFQETVSAWTRS